MVLVVVVASFVTVGLVAWRVRPRNRIGPLMMAVGLAYLLCDLSVQIGARYVASLWLGLLAQLVLAMPTGRLSSSTQRALVACAYVVILLPAIDAATRSGDHDPLGLLMAWKQWITFGLSLAFLIVQIVRWSRASVTQRRLVAPVLGSCLVVTGLFVLDKPTQHSELALKLALPLIPICYLIGLVYRRLDRAGVAGLVVRLGDVPRITRLSEELAATLHDPGVRLGFWAPARDDYVDADGQPMPPVPADRVVTRIDRGGRRIAILVHDRALLDEPELVSAACAATALALENEQLQADLRSRLRELVASRARLVHAAESGRRQLERDLHDGVQQRLLAAAMMLGRAEHGTDQALVTEAKGTVLATLAELRALCQGIHPPVLTERGLPGALRELADTAPILLDLDVTVGVGLSPEIESVAYYVVAEALTNAIKHADTAQAEVRVDRQGPRLVVRIEDHGRGGADPKSGSGLAGLADRVAAMGGELVVTSPVGHGTTVRAELPCES